MIFKCTDCQGGFTWAGMGMSHTGYEEEVWEPCVKCSGRGRVWILPFGIIVYRAKKQYFTLRYPAVEEEEIPF